jgi:competence protein ComEA
MKLALNILLVAGIVAALAGGVVLLVRGSGDGGVTITLPTPVPTASSEVKVYVTGAVNVPGVYVVSDGARVSDALEMAGGPSPDADLEAVNLARRVRDEDQVVFPRKGEASTAAATPQGVSSSSGRIDLNTADTQTLERLPGIGPVRAQAIIRYREQNGRFTRVEELLEVTGIGQATLAGIFDLVEVR